MDDKTYELALAHVNALQSIVERLDSVVDQLTLLRMGDGAILNYREAARYVDLSKATFDQAAREIPRVRLSRGRFGFIRSDLDRWLLDNKEYPEDFDEESDAEIQERAIAAARGA
mgnify:CR=1 FL=1